MTVPANLCAAWYGRSVGHAVVSIATPLNGSTIANNSTAEAVSGTASSNAGNITSVQYQIDGGAFNSITITPAPTVNYSGGNAGQVGVGNHTVTVKATDAASNVVTVSSSYTIASGSVSPSYTWTPQYGYNGSNNFLTIQHGSINSVVGYTLNQYDAHGNVISSSTSPATIGTTDVNGNFNYTSTVAYAPNAWTSQVGLYVGGTLVANFSFANQSGAPSVTCAPSVSPSGAVTLSISGEYANSIVAQTITYTPSNRSSGPTAIGSTSSTGNFSSGISLSWGSDTSALITVTLNGVGLGVFTITP